MMRNAVMVCLALAGFCRGEPVGADYPALFTNRAIFDDALAKESGPALAGCEVTGITVPHHTLAADLIARGFRLAAGGDYERVILLSPDHFQQTKHASATTRRSFQTVYGRVTTDEVAAAALLGSAPDICESDLFGSEHGIHAVLPFIAKFFPRAKILPVSLSIAPKLRDWEAMVKALAPLAAGKTLIVQSTDFSHYLSRNLARERDQQTLHALASGKVETIRTLTQPGNMDSKAAQYVQVGLQRWVHGAVPEVVENRNSFEYLGWEGSPTTSYVIQVYRKPSASLPPIPAWPGQQIWYFAGDTNFGRYFAKPLRDEAAATWLRERILAITGGARMVVNLEGVMLDPPLPGKQPPLRIGMDSGVTLRWLKSLNVAAVSLANNHALDFGPEALAMMKQRLQSEGIVALEHGEAHDLGGLRLLALRDVANHGEQRTHLVSEADLETAGNLRLAQPAFAFIHWGREYFPAPEGRETGLIEKLQERGFPLVIGAHPHVASSGVATSPACHSASVYSLGNFLFDQRGAKVSGSLVEVRIFKQGTCFMRVIELGNLYEETLRRSMAQPSGGSK